MHAYKHTQVLSPWLKLAHPCDTGACLQDMQRALPARSARGVLKEGRHDARRITQKAEVLGLVECEPGARNKQALSHSANA